jgi:hypothetical protein
MQGGENEKYLNESVLENPMRNTSERERERRLGGRKITCNVMDLFDLA